MRVTTSRQRVLALLQNRPGSSAIQVARALGMRPAAVRHHFAVLASDGRIAHSGSGPIQGRGRPAKLYRVSDAISGNNLPILASWLLDAQFEGLGTMRKMRAARSLGNRLWQSLVSGIARSSGVRFLQDAIALLNRMHYAARWEAGATGPRVLFSQCPYAALVQKHPELCQMDVGLLEALMGRDVEALTTIRERGTTHCVFETRNAAATRPPMN